MYTLVSFWPSFPPLSKNWHGCNKMAHNAITKECFFPPFFSNEKYIPETGERMLGKNIGNTYFCRHPGRPLLADGLWGPSSWKLRMLCLLKGQAREGSGSHQREERQPSLAGGQGPCSHATATTTILKSICHHSRADRPPVNSVLKLGKPTRDSSEMGSLCADCFKFWSIL